MLAMARIDEKVGLSKNRQDQSHPPLKMKLPSRVERKCGEWCEVQSKTKKKIYYLNIRTKETTWKKPPGWCDKTVSQIFFNLLNGGHLELDGSFRGHLGSDRAC